MGLELQPQCHVSFGLHCAVQFKSRVAVQLPNRMHRSIGQEKSAEEKCRSAQIRARLIVRRRRTTRQ